MSNNSAATSTGVSTFTVIGIVFIVLKLINVEPIAHWSWLWVLAPFWIPVAFGCAVFAIIFIVGFIASLFSR